MRLRLLHIALLLTTLATVARADKLGYTQENPLIFGIDIDYAPMEYVDDEGLPQGFDVEFTKRLMERLNIPFTYSLNTWENIAGDVLSGKANLGMMVYSPYRKDLTNYSRAVFRLYYQIVYRKADNIRYDLRTINGKEIAFMESRPIRDTLTKIGAKPVLIKNLNKTFHELSAGKYDAVICFRYQARYLIEREELDNLAASDLALMPREYCYVSNDKQLIKAINTELDKMEDEGVIDEVYGGVKSTFGEMAIPLWVWLVMGGLAIVGLGATVVVQSRGRKRLMEEVERAHQSEVRARESEERARKSEELKGIFLNNVSHALRTPLNAIIGFSDLMLSDEKDEMKFDERRNLLGLINTNGLQLLHLINELLNLSDIEGKEKFFNMEVTDIVAEFDKYVSEIRPQLHPGVELIVNEPVDGIRAMVDRRFMRMVNMHLLENAMQHTTEGKITLSYYVKQGGIYAEVRDTGTGLPPQLKENIFALLNDKNTYLQDEMPGLGLSICKAICDKMGGQIGARDNDIDGRGTIIWTWAEVELV